MDWVSLLVINDSGLPILWPEEWRTIYVTCRNAVSAVRPADYDERVKKHILNQFQKTSSMAAARRVISYALQAQTNKRIFLDQYFYISLKLAGALQGALKRIMAEQVNLLIPGTYRSTQEYYQFWACRRLWAMLQEHVAVALGMPLPIMPVQLEVMEFEDTLSIRAAIIRNFIRKGTCMLRRAHVEVAWCAVNVALMQVNSNRL